ncbi:MAG: thioredoxin [Hyphomicrobiaceae bacterium]
MAKLPGSSIIDDSQTNGPVGGAPGEIIKDTTTRDFMADVIEASQDALVLVDFWAPWCGPCKQLTPILEKVVRSYKGRVRLVKMNIDKEPSIPGQLGVRSIPAVFAFQGGRPVDAFMGAVPESQIKTFIERFLGEGEGDDLAAVLESADAAFEEGDVQAAAEIYAAVLGEDKENVDAIAGLAKCYVKAGDFEHAESTLAMVPQAKQSHTAVATARAMLELARKAPKASETEALVRRVESNPADHQARFDLALAMQAAGDREGAVDNLLEIVRRNRTWNEEAARKQLVQLFEAWGPKDELTLSGRRRLSAILFA